MAKIQKTKQTVQQLLADIARWRESFPAYAREQLRIIDINGDLIPFELKRAQWRLWTEVKKKVDANEPVRIYVLKARQIGFSTLIEGIGYWLATLYRYKNGLVVAHDKSAAAKLFMKMSIMYKAATYRPKTKYNSRYSLYFANPNEDGPVGNESLIRVASADNPNVGVSDTLNYVHLSELAKYDKVNSNLTAMMSKLKQAIPARPMTFVFIETTAEGFGYAKELWDDPKSGYVKVFVSWIADERYTYSEYIRRIDPNPEDHRITSVHDLSDNPDGDYGDELFYLPKIAKELRYWYPELSKEQVRAEILRRLAWRRWKIDVDMEGARAEKLRLFRQEFPSYPEEAFLTTGNSVFDNDRLSNIRYALDEHDDTGRSRGLKNPGQRFRWDRDLKEFIPTDGTGQLIVYDYPKANQRYTIGVDTSQGLADSDPGAIQVLSARELKQVAVLSGRLAPSELAEMANWIGRWYNTAWMAVEVKEESGAVVSYKLANEMHYPLLYRREIFDSRTRKYVQKVGFATSRGNKPVLVHDLRDLVHDDEFILQDPPTLLEMMYFIEDEGEFAAAQGKHDDRVMALGLAVQMMMQANLHHTYDAYQEGGNGMEPQYGTFAYFKDQMDKAQGTGKYKSNRPRRNFGH